MASYRHVAGTRYSRQPSDRKKTREERLQSALDHAWRDYFATRSQYRRGEATLEEVKTALKHLRKMTKTLGSTFLYEDELTRSLS